MDYRQFIHHWAASLGIIATDIKVNNLLLSLRDDYYTKFFLTITALGGSYIIISVLIIASLLLWFFHKKAYIIPLLLASGGSNLFSTLGKLILERTRPLAPVYLETSFSFPSSHATAAVACYGLLIYFCLKNTKKTLNKFLVISLGSILIIAIGFSRLYLGVHYLSDVVAGYILGGLWLTLGIFLTQWQLNKIKKA